MSDWRDFTEILLITQIRVTDLPNNVISGKVRELVNVERCDLSRFNK